ncbi:MAG: PTS sugar transporter subunit IIC [Gemmatimonadota bacterium]
MPSGLQFCFLLASGVLAGLDSTSLGQFLFSRPLVSGLLAGLILGDPGAALPVALVLEMYQLSSVPAGGTRFPEGGLAAVPAVTVAVGVGGGGGMLLGLAFGFLWAELGGRSIVALRRENGRRMAALDAPGTTVTLVTRLHLACLGWDLVRSVVMTLMGLGLAAVMVIWGRPGRPPGGLEDGVLLLLLVPPLTVCLGMLQPDLRRAVFLGLGVMAGLVAGWVL